MLIAHNNAVFFDNRFNATANGEYMQDVQKLGFCINNLKQ